MSLAQLSRLTLGDTGGNAIFGEQPINYYQLQALKDSIDGILNGAIVRDLPVGGNRDTIALDGEAAGNFEVYNASRIQIDNTGNRISGFTDANGASLAVQFRYFIRVSHSSLIVTPKIYRETGSPGFATISGAAGCSGTAEDFSGTQQKQTITLTLASGQQDYVPYINIAGTPTTDARVWVFVLHDRFIEM